MRRCEGQVCCTAYLPQDLCESAAPWSCRAILAFVFSSVPIKALGRAHGKPILGSTRVPRVGFGVPPKRSFCKRGTRERLRLHKSSQSRGRVRSPEGACVTTVWSRE